MTTVSLSGTEAKTGDTPTTKFKPKPRDYKDVDGNTHYKAHYEGESTFVSEAATDGPEAKIICEPDKEPPTNHGGNRSCTFRKASPLFKELV